MRLPLCDQCAQLGSSHSIVRSAQRFAVKHYGAQLLSARLFRGEQAAHETLQTIKATPLYKSRLNKIEDVLAKDTTSLQQWVRCSWTSDWKPSSLGQSFMDTVVQPCLDVSVASVPERLVDCVATFQAMLKGDQISEEQMMHLKVASLAVTGQIERHPLLLGLCLQTQRMLEKQDRGLESMAGRRSKESEAQSAVIRDAALQLAVNTGNNRFVREFGLSSSAARFKYEELNQLSLPSPALAIDRPEDLANNFVLADQRYARKPHSSQRTLAFCGLWMGKRGYTQYSTYMHISISVITCEGPSLSVDVDECCCLLLGPRKSRDPVIL